MKIKKDYILHEIGDTAVVVPVGEASREFHGIMELNKTAQYIWGAFLQGHSEEEIAFGLTEEFEVDLERAKAAVQSLKQQMYNLGVAED